MSQARLMAPGERWVLRLHEDCSNALRLMRRTQEVGLHYQCPSFIGSYIQGLPGVVMLKERPSFNCFPQISITENATFEKNVETEEIAEIASDNEVANAFANVVAITSEMSGPGPKGACGIWPPPRASARGGPL
jgi:hypothetical protein